MSGRDEELLSAYYDGEVTADERAAAEQLLAQDAARETLEEIAEVSEWIRQLPRPAAPAGLRDAVLAQLRPVPTLQPPTAHPSRRYSGWLALTAAGLLVGVLLYHSVPDGSQVLVTKSTVPSDAREKSSGAAGIARSDMAADASTPEPTRVALADTNLLLERFRDQMESGDVPVPGETLTDVTQVGDQVVIVEYGVVDRQEMLGQVQVLLSRNGIYPVDAENAELDVSTMSTDLQALFVAAPNNSFAKAVEELPALKGVKQVTANTVASLQAETEVEGLGIAGKPAPLAANAAAAPPHTVVESAATEAAESVSDEPGAPPEAVADASTLGLTPQNPASELRDEGTFAYQVAVPVPPALAQQLRTEMLPDAETARSRRFSAQKSLPRVARNFRQRQAQRAGQPAERVRAVILLVPERQP